MSNELELVSKEKNPGELLDELVRQAIALIDEAENIATKHDLEFNLNIAYGMGGWFSSGEWHPSYQLCI